HDGRAAVHQRGPLQRDHGGRGRARAPEDDDGLRHHGRAPPDHVEPRHRRRGDATHRRADDRRHGVVDIAHADRYSVDLCRGQRHRDPITAHSPNLAGNLIGGGRPMMHDMMTMMSGMGWMMGLVWLLFVLVLVLAVAALVKYLFFKSWLDCGCVTGLANPKGITYFL